MAGLYPSSSVPYWKSLRVLRSILAVARIALFWPEILDVTPGICWSPSLRRLPQEPVLSSPFTSSLAPLSALSISWASLIPPDVAVIWYSYTYHYSFLLLLFQHQYVQLVSHQKVVHLYLEVQHDLSSVILNHPEVKKVKTLQRNMCIWLEASQRNSLPSVWSINRYFHLLSTVYDAVKMQYEISGYMKVLRQRVDG